MADQPGGEEVGAIFATIRVSTNNLQSDMGAAKRVMEAASAATDKLVVATDSLSGSFQATARASKAAADKQVYDSERSLQAAMKGMNARSKEADRAAAAESKAALKAGQDAIGAFLIVEKASKQTADKQVYDSERSLQAAMKGMNARSQAASQAASQAGAAGLAAGTASFSGAGAAASFASYASQSEAATRATIGLAKAQADSRSAATAAFAAYGNLGTAQVRVAEKTDATTKSTRNLGFAGLTAGRALQDFTQGGLGGILNNIEGLAMALGGGPGLAGLLTAAGVAAFVAKPFLASMFDTKDVNPFRTELEKIKDRIDELGKQEIKIGVDRLELDRLEKQYARIKKAQEDFDAATGRKSAIERESETAVKELIDEAGATGVRDKLKGKIGGQLVADDEKSGALKRLAGERAQAERDLKHAETHADDYGDPMAWAAALERMQNRIDTLEEKSRTRRAEILGPGGEAEKKVGALIGEGEAGKVGEHQEGLAKALEASGQGALASEVRRKTPKNLRAEHEEDAASEAEQEYLKESGKEWGDRLKDFRKENKEREANAELIEKKDVQAEAKNADDARKNADAEAKEAARVERDAAKKEKAEAAKKEAARLRLMTPAQRKSFLQQRDRGIVSGRTSPDGGDGIAPDAPAMPNVPAAGAGDVGMTARQADMMLEYLKEISGNTDDMGDDATFG